MELRDYQKEMVDSIFEKLQVKNSILCQSATGSGKTVIMSAFLKEWIEKNPNKKILVSVHREELVQQTSETLARFGILNEIINAKSKPNLNKMVFVGMTQTIWSRKYNIDIDLMIIDEAHEQVHVKSFDLFKKAKRVGFTATPIINKRITYYECDYCNTRYEKKQNCCYNEPAYKWSAPVTMSETYNDIIVGVPIKKLIEQGSLVDEITFTYNYYENLTAKENDDFDENDIAEESIKHDLNVLEEYKEKALGKKTMIFTASTKQNLSLVDTFKEYQIKSYDSVNNESNERSYIVEWFRNTKGAILVSTGTFTTGFDVKEVECIIINRPTQSLSLWLQIVGRGARPSDLIFKENFIVIDLGGNVNRLGRWSDNIDWRNIFFNGLKPAKKKNPTIMQCQKCDYNFIGNKGDECPDCGHVNIIQDEVLNLGGPKEGTTELTNKKTTSVSVVPIPNGRKIAEFVRRTSDNKNDYYNILINKYVDLWKLNRVPPEIYFQRKKTGYLEHKIMSYLKQNYGYVNILSEGVPRSYDYLLNRIKSKLEKCYIDK
jgi:superfamily II DNA or RNA helicase